VLVGGREYGGENVSGEPTNKLWTLSEDGQWQETLPPMPTPCAAPASAVSHGDHLLVISDATYNYRNNKIYVYNGHHWASAQHPPEKLRYINSTIFNGHWYVMGYEGIVYSASLDSLLASCQPSEIETSQPSSLWRRLTDAPSRRCYPLMFGNRLIAVKTIILLSDTSITSSLYAYSSLTQSWVHMGDVKSPSISVNFSIIAPCAVLLSSTELMIVVRRTSLQSKLTCKFIAPLYY
jgi:hypothetical protein